MPTYEYECEKCSKRFERFQSINAKPLAKCPDCGGRARRRISAGGGVIFKGSGFYETDYKRGSAPQSDKKPDSKDSGKKDGENSKEKA
jgi:putative FmdB family regulatory protein